jgi:hypothetical protein
LPDDQDSYVFEKEGKKLQFYKLIKDLNLKTDQVKQTIEGGFAPTKFFDKCNEQRIVAHPVFAKVDTHNQRLILTDFLISESMSLAMESYFGAATAKEDKIKELHLERNGLKD